MLDRAKSINLNSQGEIFSVDMRQAGFGSMSLKTRNLSNLRFAEYDLDAYELTKPHPYDLITAVNLLDRLASVPVSLRTLFNLLASGGVLICCTPLNFTVASEWDSYGSPEKIIELIRSIGFTIEAHFDGLPYREILDNRGAYEEYPTLILKAIKP
jgi:2-polyprenyl-3-methyl-5-hydroxy-6-metoxy-1,4-benzoquinol methylase